MLDLVRLDLDPPNCETWLDLWRVLLASPVKLPTYNRVKPKNYDSVSELGVGMRIAPILRKYFR